MKKILIAEDDKFLISAYRLKLEKNGFEVIIAKNGQEALLKMGTDKPDLVILDLIMPVLDGFGVLEEVNKNETLKKIPIIVASNLGQKEDIDRGMSLGAIDYFVKSDTNLNEIIDKIKQAF